MWRVCEPGQTEHQIVTEELAIYKNELPEVTNKTERVCLIPEHYVTETLRVQPVWRVWIITK
jgi:hypothetical protein